MAKNELPGNRVAYASEGVAGEGSPDRNQRLTEVSLPHPDLTPLARAQGSEAHPPEQEGQWPIGPPEFWPAPRNSPNASTTELGCPDPVSVLPQLLLKHGKLLPCDDFSIVMSITS